MHNGFWGELRAGITCPQIGTISEGYALALLSVSRWESRRCYLKAETTEGRQGIPGPQGLATAHLSATQNTLLRLNDRT
jgi:hypothetical protein